MTEIPEDLVRHMLLKQLYPQVLAEKTGGKAMFVYTGDEEIPGAVALTCRNCGATAQMVNAPEGYEGGTVLCPDCLPQ